MDKFFYGMTVFSFLFSLLLNSALAQSALPLPTPVATYSHPSAGNLGGYGRVGLSEGPIYDFTTKHRVLFMTNPPQSNIIAIRTDGTKFITPIYNPSGPTAPFEGHPIYLEGDGKKVLVYGVRRALNHYIYYVVDVSYYGLGFVPAGGGPLPISSFERRVPLRNPLVLDANKDSMPDIVDDTGVIDGTSLLTGSPTYLWKFPQDGCTFSRQNLIPDQNGDHVEEVIIQDCNAQLVVMSGANGKDLLSIERGPFVGQQYTVFPGTRIEIIEGPNKSVFALVRYLSTGGSIGMIQVTRVSPSPQYLSSIQMPTPFNLGISGVGIYGSIFAAPDRDGDRLDDFYITFPYLYNGSNNSAGVIVKGDFSSGQFTPIMGGQSQAAQLSRFSGIVLRRDLFGRPGEKTIFIDQSMPAGMTGPFGVTEYLAY